MSAADEIRRLLLNLNNGATVPIRMRCAAEFNAYFYNNAEAIAELIEAAEKTAQTNLLSSKASRENHINQCVYETQNALAKLNAGNGEQG